MPSSTAEMLRKICNRQKVTNLKFTASQNRTKKVHTLLHAGSTRSRGASSQCPKVFALCKPPLIARPPYRCCKLETI